MNAIKIAEKLIRISSYVDSKTNEAGLALWLVKFFQDLAWLKIKKNTIGKNRFNLIVSDGYPAKLVFCSHMDTVQPTNIRSLSPKISGSKLYGLGAVDMKAGIASLLDAVKSLGPTRGLTLIFDCDEEYYFNGIKKILGKFNLRPELVICPEPTDLEIINGCRGCVEIEFSALGKTAHAGNPEEGVNAIETVTELVKELKLKLCLNDIKKLGKTTVNLSTILGGRLVKNEIKTQANAVPDTAKLVLDIRPANPKLNADKIFDIITKLATKYKLKIVNKRINIDYQPYYIEGDKITNLERAIKNAELKVKYNRNLDKAGFFESALINKMWQCPAINFGPGPASQAHKTDEFVNIKSVNSTQKVYQKLIEQLCL